MYPYYYPQNDRWGAVSGTVGIIALLVSVGVVAIAAYNASNNRESLEIMREHYGARSAL